jgi:hypothetical protein
MPARHALILLTIACASSAHAQPNTTANYEVVFDATWSASTHPTDFPPTPHFSWLIGGTHNDQVVFWAVGDTASLGIRRMAEWGSVNPLDTEVAAAIAAGDAGQIVESEDYVLSPGVLTTNFEATPDHPLVTLVTMVAPSPDWFTGVADLDLRDGNGWVDELVVDLYPYDAGTDSGPTYTSPDQPTVPQVPVAAITGYPFSPPGGPLGTFTFRLLQVTAVPQAPAIALTAFPNPFNPRTTIRLEVPAAGHVRLTVHDVRGRRVRRLADRQVVAGPLRVLWDGLDDAGRDTPSGVYLVRARVGAARATTRVVLTR